MEVSVASVGERTRVRMAWPELVYGVLVFTPVHFKSCVLTVTTAFGSPAGSGCTVTESFTGPEHLTFSGAPTSVPDTCVVKLESASCARAAGAARRRATARPKRWKALAFMFHPVRSVRGWQDIVRRDEGDALARRDGRGQRVQLGEAQWVEVPSQEHRVVLVGGVVAMLHEGAGPVAELDRQGDATRGSQPVDVLSALLPRRDVDGGAVAQLDLALLEVDVDRVVPSAPLVRQRPQFAAAVAVRRCRDPAVIGVQDGPGVRADAPRPCAGGASGGGGGGAAIEHEVAPPADAADHRIGDQVQGHLAHVGR